MSVITDYVDFQQKSQKLLEYLDLVIRGNSKLVKSSGVNTLDIESIESLCISLLDWISSEAAFAVSKAGDEEQKKIGETLAVKINGKGRNLASGTYTVVKAYSKIISAWLIFLFAFHNGRAVQIVVSILGSNFKDLKIPKHKLRCCRGAIKAWEEGNLKLNVSRELSPANVQELKLTVFQTLIEEAKLIILLREEHAFESANRLLSQALEQSQTLPLIYVVNLADSSMKLGVAIANTPIMIEEAKSFFMLSLTTIDSIQSRLRLETGDKLNQIKEITEGIKVHSGLALSYIHMEMR